MAVNKALLAKEVDGVMHYIYPKTSADMVDYTDTKTVKQKLDEIEANIVNANVTANEALAESRTISNEVQDARTAIADGQEKPTLKDRLDVDFGAIQKTFDDHIAESHHDMITKIERNNLTFTAYNAGNEELFTFDQRDTTYTAGQTLTLIGNQFNHDDSGVKAGKYGSSTTASVITVDAQGHVTNAESVTISDVKPADHTHGNITNDGAVSGEITDLGPNDTVLIADASDGYNLKRSSLTFGESTTTFLRGDGQFAAPVEAGTAIEVDGTTVSHKDSTVKPGVYGSSTTTPKVTVDQQGHVTSVETVEISDVPPAEHTHGTITNDGKLSGDTVEYESGDSLVLSSIIDGTIKKSEITIGTSQSKFLSNSGEWLDPVIAGDGIEVSSNTVSHVKSGIAAGEHGSSTTSPKITLDDMGHIVGIEEIIISGTTPGAHSHGNITNEGAIVSDGSAVSEGDKLVFADGNTGTIDKSSISFGQDNTRFLSNTGAWATAAEAGDGLIRSGTNLSHVKTSIGANTTPEGMVIPKFSIDDMGHIVQLSSENVPTLSGANAESDGIGGLTPTPKAGQEEYYLKGDGTWSEIVDKYHVTGEWEGLTYTATPVGNAGPLSFTIPIGTNSQSVASGDHTHGQYAGIVHSHGNINNDGTINTDADTPVMTGDSILISHGEDGNISKSDISFDSEDTTSFLRKDGTWAIPPDTKYTAGEGLNLSESNEFNVDFDKVAQADHVHEVTSTDKAGFAPALSGSQNEFLNGNGEWAIPEDTTYSAGNGLSLSEENAFSVNFAGSGEANTSARSDHIHDLASAEANGFMPKLNSDNTKYLDGEGNWSTPHDTTYTAGDGLELAGTEFSVSYGGDGESTTVSRSDHTHPVATADAEGFMPTLTDNAGQFLNGKGAWSTPVDTKYTAGEGLNLSESNQFSADFTKVATADHVHDVTTAEKAGFAPTLSDVATQYLNGQGEWTVPPDTKYAAGDGLALAGTKFSVSYGGDGEATTVSRSDHTHDVATVDTEGFMPNLNNNESQFLNGKGAWSTPKDTTYTAGAGLELSETNEFTVSFGDSGSEDVAARNDHAHAVADSKNAGFLPVLKNDKTYYLDGSGNWSVPTDTKYSAGDGLTLNGTKFAVSFAGDGTATTVAHSDHKHDLATADDAGFMPNLNEDTTYFLNGNGEWSKPVDTKYTAGAGLTLTGTEFKVSFAGSGTAITAAHSDHVHDVVTSKAAGFAPVLSDVATQYLNGAGKWTVPPDTKYTAGDGLALSGTQFAVSYGGSGTAATVSHSDHTHIVTTADAAGFAPALSGTATEYLNGAGKWTTPPDTKYNHPTSTAAGSYGSTTVIPKITVDGLGHVTAVANQTVATMTGASGTAAGTVGFVPAPKLGQQNYFLKGDGTWSEISINTSEMVGAGASADGVGGTVPAPKKGEQNYFLRGDGTWAVVATTNSYHTSGTWSGLKYTATPVGGAGALEFTIPTGTNATTVALGNHTHGNASGTAAGFMSSADKTNLDTLYKGRIWAEDLDT